MLHQEAFDHQFQLKSTQPYIDTPLQQFLDDEQRFDGLANANVVRDEQTGHFLTQRHDQGNDLIGTWAERELGKTAERARTVAE